MKARPLLLELLLLLPVAVLARDIHYGAAQSAAVQACDEQAWRGETGAAKRCYAKILAGNAPAAARAEAAWALGERQAANEHFRRATSADPDDLQTLLRWGDLYAASHQDAEAMDIYTEVLAKDSSNAYAMLGAARLLAGRFSDEAGGYLERILDGDAAAGAKAAAYLLIARIQLENGDFGQAGEALDKAEKLIDGNAWPLLEVYALRAALDIVEGQDESVWIERSLDVNPHYGNVYALPAHFLIIQRRYRQGIDLYRKAVDIEPALAHAQEQLGINLLRDNQVAPARRHLEAAYAEDPFSPRTVNTLRLLDSLGDFRLVEDTGGAVPIVLRLHEDEADVIAPYAIELIQDSIAEFTPRYGFELAEPVVVEMYPDHEDFAVRTAGMPGLGILGATFGYVVAMDSPSGRTVEEFQWGTTLWHEMAHVFTLEATRHRVPRWFSEGVSVYEEWRSGPNAGLGIPLMVMFRMREGAFLPVAELDEGFIRPRYEGQVMVSYMQAGLICRFIERHFGEGKLEELLVAWRDGANTPGAIRSVLGIDSDDFDDAFNDAIDVEFGRRLARLDHWGRQRQRLSKALEDEQWATAGEIANDMLTLMPDVVTANSPYLALAKARHEQGREAESLEALKTFWRRGGFETNALTELARGLRDAGDLETALEVYASINLVAPFDEEVHGEHGELLLAAGRPEEALREFEVALAQSPHDMATARYRMARARAELGELEAAQRQLLEALDIAPGFRPAQKLLLEIAGAGQSSQRKP